MEIPLAFLLERSGVHVDPSHVQAGAFVKSIYLLDALLQHDRGIDENDDAGHRNGAISLENEALYIGSDAAFRALSEREVRNIPRDTYLLIDAIEETTPPASDKPRYAAALMRFPNALSETQEAPPLSSQLERHVVEAAPFDALATFNRAIGVYFRLNEWGERFQALLQDPENRHELMKECSALFGNAAYLVDASFKVIAIDDTPLFSEISSIWKHLVEEGYLPYDIVYSMHASKHLAGMAAQSEATLCEAPQFNNPFINCNLSDQASHATGEQPDGMPFGHFFVVGYQKRITQGELILANQIGSLLAQFVQRFSLSNAHGSPHEAFLERLMDGAPLSAGAIARQIAPWGWEETDDLCAIAVSEASEGASPKDILIMQLEHEFNMRCIIAEGIIVGIVNMKAAGSESAERAKSKLELFLARRQCIAAISDYFTASTLNGVYFRQAKTALACMLHPSAIGSKAGKCLSMGERPALRAFGDCFMECVAYRMAQANALDDFMDERALGVLAFDMDNDTEYARTLRTYLRNDRRLNETASQLYIHRNTLLYRIRRLKEHFGIDLEDPEQRMRLLLSLEALKLQLADAPLPVFQTQPNTV